MGSLNVNGSVRTLFGSDYFGIDRQDGPGVDRVMSAHDLDFPDGEFDAVVSTEMFEHDDRFWISCKEMGRVLKPGGYLILTARGNGFQKHEYPSDFYRFMPESYEILFQIANCKTLEIIEDPQYPGVFGIGMKCS